MQKLKAPAGTTDVSFGGINYKIDDKGIVEVPDEATLTLFQFGFSVYEETIDEAPEGKFEADAVVMASAITKDKK